jgi:methylenetetrahydrofolate dehydrogenase (NADP+)/methenyltetrahydrofolate cyclohydrolase
LWVEVEQAAADLIASRGRAPRLAILRLGEDPASVWYARQIERQFSRRRLETSIQVLPADTPQAGVADAIRAAASDREVDAILLQLPLPSGLELDALVELIPPAKDLEGLHPYNAGRLALGQPTFVPSTALAGLELLRRSGIRLEGQLAVIVGRSQIIGRPLASLLIQENATVVTCHTRTRDLGALTSQADILFAAAGRPGLVTAEMVRPGAVVVDFGTSEVDGKLVGDVDFEPVSAVAYAITPVPGGTGPVTTAVLGDSLVRAAKAGQRAV